MPTHIKKLNCRVTVRAGSKKSIPHQTEKAAKPAMHFAIPQPEARSEAPTEPSLTATEGNGTATGSRQKPSVKQADARAVADRVMELMKQEMRLARERGAGR